MASDSQTVDVENPNPQALALKDEGNALYAQKKYAEALDKYSGAIAHDDKNAVFWTNRAACKLNLQKYVDELLLYFSSRPNPYHYRPADAVDDGRKVRYCERALSQFPSTL